MILNSAPQDTAVLSNVGEIGEFRIRNSAKAFNILSSGLYANKVKAIIRELSCNAIDSHTAAGTDAAFEMHLPTALEPWFSIRDFGTGLSHEQVTHLYTTYFESTKTDSNAFIGALGLGSKSPFSYTDNFTVTAMKDGRKGIYTAFINGEGVPSIVLMMEESCELLDTGVEVKFSVNDRFDFAKFHEEARSVFTFFKQRPVVTGATNFTFDNVEYDSKDIIPGVHSVKTMRGMYRNGSYAVMGNIGYPIEVPKADTTLGGLRELLDCNLVMEFPIGALDFQASREGLSYIPSTIEAIKNKLEALNAELASHIAKEADKKANVWERADYLYMKKDSKLWLNAIIKYVRDTKFEHLIVPATGTTHHSYNVRRREVKLAVADIASKYNISLKAFSKQRGSTTCSTLNAVNEHTTIAQQAGYTRNWCIDIDLDAKFVVNDTNTGAFERSKYHWRQTEIAKPSFRNEVYVLEKVDRSKVMDTAAFFADLYNPPHENIFNASSLKMKDRVVGGAGKNVSILKLEQKSGSRWGGDTTMVWRDAGKVDSFDKAGTYYYLPLVGFNVQSISTDASYNSGKDLQQDLAGSGLKELAGITVYGVRKTDIDVIKNKSNWVNLETFVKRTLSSVSDKQVCGMARQALDNSTVLHYNKVLEDKINAQSPFAKLMRKFEGVEKIRYSSSCIDRLCEAYGGTVDVKTKIKELADEQAKVNARYPLLTCLGPVVVSEVSLAEYINLVDEKKGI